jgi:arsenical pump membrane protein
VALTLAGFVVCSFTSVNPAWAAVAGALALAVPTIAGRRTTVGRVVASTSPLFLVFVLALAVLVQAVLDNGLDNVLGALLLSGDGLPALLATAAVAAVLANLINNLPAVLALLPLVSPGGAGPVLAVLIGVNVGPNLTYAGSLATLLWRRVLSAHGTDVDLRDFTRLGLLTVPATLVGASTSLWLVLRLR